MKVNITVQALLISHIDNILQTMKINVHRQMFINLCLLFYKYSK